MRAGSPEPARPRLRDDVPFMLLAFIGVVPAILSTEPSKVWLLLVTLAVTLPTVAVHIAAMRRDRHSWVDPLPSWLFVLILALLRDATGGPTSNLAPLVAIPILWIALFGTRTELAVTAALTFASFTAPHLIDPGTYPGNELHRALLWTGFAALVAPVIQSLVRQLAIRTEQERHTAARLHGVLQGATLSSLITTDERGTITSVNQGAEDLLGYRADELVGQHATVLHDPAEIAEVAAELGVPATGAVLCHLAHLRSPSRIWRYVCKDGHHRFVRLAMTMLVDDGQTVGYLGVAIDATAAEEANEALAAAEQRWRMVAEQLPDLTIVMLDEDLVVSMVAGAGALSTGLTAALGSSLKQFSTPANVKALTAGVHAALAGQDNQIEMRSTVNESDHQTTFRAMPVSEHGRREVLTLSRDVSKERARERAVAAARDRAESLLNDAPHGVAVLTRDGVIEQVNPALCRLLGRTEAELVTTTLSAAPGAHAAALAEHLAQLATRPPGSAAVHAEWAVDLVNGGRTHLGVGSTVIVGPDGDQILMTFTDLSERHQHEQELSWLAEHDALTGLANRRRFELAVNRHLASPRTRAGGALLMLDLDHFKAVNDTDGHSAGDRLLVTVGQTLRGAVRSTDLVARLGGDEFAILLTDADRLSAEVVAEHIVSQTRATVSAQQGAAVGVTVSVGIVMIDADTCDPEALMAKADLTMYDAKHGGRDRWMVLGPDATEAVTRPAERRGWSGQLQQALHHDLLELHLQPIHVVAAGCVSGANALLRMREGDRLVGPDRFLPQLKRSGLAREIDQWTIGHGIAMLSRLQKLNSAFGLAIDLSGASLEDPLTERALRTAMAEHPINATQLIIAVGESRPYPNPALARSAAERIVATGCTLALDDFGVGSASLTYVRNLPFAFLRISGDFVRGCVQNEADRAIVSSVVSLAHGFGMGALAEGVDDAATFDAVVAQGADFLQGDHIGRAVPWQDFVEQHGLGQLSVSQ